MIDFKAMDEAENEVIEQMREQIAELFKEYPIHWVEEAFRRADGEALSKLVRVKETRNE